MQVLVFGSLNIDHIYAVPHFVAPGETLAGTEYHVNAGGKGLNQSVALSRAGVATAHAGMIGPEGGFLKKVLADSGVDTTNVITGKTPTGHAIIQVEAVRGQNSILLYPGANAAIPETEMSRILRSCPEGCWLLLQNEINSVPYLIREGKKRGLHVAINPAPCTEAVREYPLELCDLIFVNEIEAAQLTGREGPERELADLLAGLYPRTEIVITLGKKGALYCRGGERIAVPAHRAKAVDTTSAGDTFTGYFMAARLRGMGVREALEAASLASSITVSRPGAASSIPLAAEVFS